MAADTRSPKAGSLHRQLPKAWWSLILFPVSFVVAFVIGEGLPTWLGFDAAEQSPPWWAVALVFAVAAAIFASPLLVTAYFSNRAAEHGEAGARVPFIFALVLIAAFILVNAASGLLVLLFG
jgi:hypothetical protein